MSIRETRTTVRRDLGRYRLLLGLGRGGMAEVFVAVARGHAGFNKLVVVKRLLPGMAEDEDFREMFLQEARLAARLNHPNVVQTQEVVEHEEGLFLVMEYLEGQPLSRLQRELQKDGRRLPPSAALQIASGVLAGLHHAHELRDFDGTPLRVVHRDVSPQNVFVGYDGHVKVLDFGIAKAERSSSKTQPGWVKGKYAYMAPEQFETDTIDCRVDVFTAGILLWEMLAGRSLFGGGTEAQIIQRVLHAPVPRLTELGVDVPDALDVVLARALARDPSARFPSALAFRAELESVLAGLAGSRPDVGAIVAASFADVRARIETKLKEQLSGSMRLELTAGAEDVPTGDALRPSQLVPSSGSLSVAAGMARTASPPTSTARSELPPGLRAGRRTATFALAAAAVGVLVVAGLVGRGGSGAPPPVAARALDPAPPAPAEALTLGGSQAAVGPSVAHVASASASAASATSPAEATSAPSRHAAARAAAAPTPARTATGSRAAAPSAAPNAPGSAPNDPAEPGARRASAAAASTPPSPPPPPSSSPQEGRRFRTTF